MCVQNDVFIIVCVEVRGQNSLAILTLFLRQDLSLNLEVIDSARVAVKCGAPEIILSLYRAL